MMDTSSVRHRRKGETSGKADDTVCADDKLRTQRVITRTEGLVTRTVKDNEQGNTSNTSDNIGNASNASDDILNKNNTSEDFKNTDNTSENFLKLPSANFSRSWTQGEQWANSSSSSSASDSEDVDTSRRKSLHERKSASEYKKRSPQKRHLARCNSAPEQTNVLSDLLSSSQRVVAGAEDLVRSFIEAGYRLVHHRALPDWLKDNEYLVFGHRLPLNSFRECFNSVFKIHTETGNIWTHLIGMLAFMFIAAYTLSSRYIDWMWQDITVHSVFFGGAILCLTFSWVFHTVFCHSPNVHKLFSKLDYCGIALLTVGSFVPWLYYGFYNSKTAHVVYLVCIIVLGTSCIIVSLFDRFAAPEYRPIRAGLFIALGLTGVIPAAHFVAIEGFKCAVYEFGFLHLVSMAVFYIGGALLYAFRVPESIWPGKFDIWFQSHQIFHICVILAALVHFRGIQIISHARLNTQACAHM